MDWCGCARAAPSHRSRPHHRADQAPGIAHCRYVNGNPTADHEGAVKRGPVIVAIEQNQIAVGHQR